jgi:hypothetical protein
MLSAGVPDRVSQTVRTSRASERIRLSMNWSAVSGLT